MKKERSAGVVIFRREEGGIKYLLLHYEAGHWEYVKGHIEKGEDEITTLKREAEEETGITDLEVLPNFRYYINYFFKNKNTTISKDVHFYVAETKTKEIKLSREHVGYKWLDYESALKKVSFKNSKDVLKKANELITKI